MKIKILVVVLCFASFFANGQTKVGTINSEFIVGLMPEAKNVLSKLNVYAARLDSSYQVKLSEYNSKVTAFQKLDPSLSDNFKKIKVQEINELEQDLQKSQQNGNSLISLKKDQLMNPLYQILGEAITEIAKAEGFTQVLTSSGNEFAYIDGAFDITEKVMAKLGVKMPPPVKN
jgi:outer membrane protein|tara:strand:+ start:676 stop:1197 length:522 start_codon:yes stop_codon:yes gene_type:complete